MQVTSRLAVDVNVIGTGSSYARGNENNQHAPDGTYYLGDGTADGYAITNLGARLALTPRLQVIAQVNNVFDQRYATGAQLGPAGFTADGAVRLAAAAGRRWRVPRAAHDVPGRGGSAPRLDRRTPAVLSRGRGARSRAPTAPSRGRSSVRTASRGTSRRLRRSAAPRRWRCSRT